MHYVLCYQACYHGFTHTEVFILRCQHVSFIFMFCTVNWVALLCLGGRSHEAYSNRACLFVCMSVCSSSERRQESAGCKCKIDLKR